MVSPDELMDGRHTRWQCHFVIRIAQIFRELCEMIEWIFYVDSWYNRCLTLATRSEISLIGKRVEVGNK